MIAALAASLIIVAVGWPLAALLDRQATFGRRLAQSYLVGAGVVFAVLFVESLIGVTWSRASVLVPLIAAAAAGVTQALLPVRAQTRVSVPHVHWIDALTVLLVAGYARFATIAPTPEYDFIGIWGVKAKEFWFAHGIDWRFLEHPFNEFAHVDYPLLLPLVFDFHALVAGAWPDRWLGVVNICFGVATLLVVRSMLAEEISEEWLRALATLALVPFVLSPWIGLAECAIVAYGTTALLMLRRAALNDSAIDAICGAMALGLAANAKNEGLTLIVAAAVAMLSARPRLLARLWPAIALAVPWQIVRAVHHLRTDLTTGSMIARAAEHLANPAEVFAAMARYPLGKPFFWCGIIAAMLIGARRLPRERFLALAIVVQLLFFVGAYLITPHDVTWHVRWSWERIVAQLTAAIGFLAVVVVLANESVQAGFRRKGL